MNGSELCKLLRRQPLKKRAGWKMAQAKSVKKSGSQDRKNDIKQDLRKMATGNKREVTYIMPGFQKAFNYVVKGARPLRRVAG